MAEAAAAVATANHGSNTASGTSTPGSRFKVDATDSRKNSSGSPVPGRLFYPFSVGLRTRRSVTPSRACNVAVIAALILEAAGTRFNNKHLKVTKMPLGSFYHLNAGSCQGFPVWLVKFLERFLSISNTEVPVPFRRRLI